MTEAAKKPKKSSATTPVKSGNVVMLDTKKQSTQNAPSESAGEKKG